MFSGIIKHTGKISKIYKCNNNCIIEILSNIKFLKSEIGSSISCSGACLTLERYKKNLSNFYYIAYRCGQNKRTTPTRLPSNTPCPPGQC